MLSLFSLTSLDPTLFKDSPVLKVPEPKCGLLSELSGPTDCLSRVYSSSEREAFVKHVSDIYKLTHDSSGYFHSHKKFSRAERLRLIRIERKLRSFFGEQPRAEQLVRQLRPAETGRPPASDQEDQTDAGHPPSLQQVRKKRAEKLSEFFGTSLTEDDFKRQLLFQTLRPWRSQFPDRHRSLSDSEETERCLTATFPKNQRTARTSSGPRRHRESTRPTRTSVRRVVKDSIRRQSPLSMDFEGQSDDEFAHDANVQRSATSCGAPEISTEKEELPATTRLGAAWQAACLRLHSVVLRRRRLQRLQSFLNDMLRLRDHLSVEEMLPSSASADFGEIYRAKGIPDVGPLIRDARILQCEQIGGETLSKSLMDSLYMFDTDPPVDRLKKLLYSLALFLNDRDLVVQLMTFLDQQRPASIPPSPTSPGSADGDFPVIRKPPSTTSGAKIRRFFGVRQLGLEQFEEKLADLRVELDSLSSSCKDARSSTQLSNLRDEVDRLQLRLEALAESGGRGKLLVSVE